MLRRLAFILALFLALLGLQAVTPDAAHVTTSAQAALSFPGVNAGILQLNISCVGGNGVAPEQTLCEAGTSTDSVIPSQCDAQLVFHCVYVFWNWGDFTTSGTAKWGAGAFAGINSKNVSRGMIAAHVYQEPGTYTVTATATDGINIAIPQHFTVTVGDPEVVFNTSTACVSSVGVPQAGVNGCPMNAVAFQQSSVPATALATQLGNGIRRILFDRAGTYTCTAPAIINVNGPGIVGSYGTGSSAYIGPCSGNPESIIQIATTSATVTDWRIMDLELDGASSISTYGVYGKGSFNNVTLLRMNIHDIHVAVEAPVTQLNILNGSTHCTGAFPFNGACPAPIWTQFAVHDSTLQRSNGPVSNNGGNLVFVSGGWLSFQGNVINNSTNGEHGERHEMILHSVLCNNSISNPAAALKATLTIRAPDFAGGATVPAGNYTEQLEICDGKQDAGTVATALMSVLPQNNIEEDRFRNIMIEGNWFVAGPAMTSQAVALTSATLTTFRDNLLDLTLAPTGFNGLAVGWNSQGISQHVDKVYAYQNTFVGLSAAQHNLGIINFSDTLSTNQFARNNLVYAPMASCGSTCYVVNVASGAGVTQSNNSGLTPNFAASQVRTANPNFTSSNPITPQGSKPVCATASTYPCGQGIATAAIYDLLGVKLPPSSGLWPIGSTSPAN